MGIFDIFTNDAAKNAAQQNTQLYNQYGTTANNALGTYDTNANNIYGSAYNTGTNYLTGYGDKAAGAVTTGANNAIGAYTPLSDLATKYGGATNLYLDALGVNGAAGDQRAVNAFQAGPGYQFAVDEATKAAANKAASLGIAGSGNTLDEIRNRAQGFANQEYGNYLNRLGGFLPYEASTTAQAASGKAGIYGNEGSQLAGIYGNTGSSLAGLSSADAAARAGVAGNVAQGQIGVAGNVASGTANANNAEAQAAQNGSATFWNALAQLGGSAAKGYFGGKAA